MASWTFVWECHSCISYFLALFTIHQNVVIFKSETALTTIGQQYFVQSDWLKRTCANVAIFSVHHFMMFTIIFLDNLLTQNWDAVCPDGSEWLWENNDRATPLWSFRWSASGEYTGYKKLDYVGCKFFWRFGVLWRRRLPSWVKCIADIYHNHTTGGGVLFSSWGRERDIFAYFGQLWLFCHEFTHFLVYFLQA